MKRFLLATIIPLHIFAMQKDHRMAIDFILNKDTPASASPDKHIEEKVLLACPKCSYSTFSQEAFVSHAQTHEHVYLFKCPYPDCQYIATQKGHVRSHMSRVHPISTVAPQRLDTPSAPK